MSNAHVSIIVPTYNRASYLAEALTGLLEQTIKPLEVIVVDDGSTDDTHALVATFGSRVRYIRKINGGKSSALNMAMPLVTGDLVWIFDDDDVPAPNALSLMREALLQAPEADFAFGHYDNFTTTDKGDIHKTEIAAPSFSTDDLFCALLARCFIFQAALMVRRPCYEAIGSFDIAFTRAQDYDMIVRLSRHFTGIHIPQVLFHQRQHEGVRGTATVSIDGKNIWERQKHYDAAVVKKAVMSSELSDFLPFSLRHTWPNPVATIHALLRRTTVCARKKLWDASQDSAKTALQLANDLNISSPGASELAFLRSVFDEFSYATDDLDVDNVLLCAVKDAPRSAFSSAVISALLWPVFRYILKGIRNADFKTTQAYSRVYFRFMDRDTLITHLALRRKRRSDT